jgi:hypothetical protein
MLFRRFNHMNDVPKGAAKKAVKIVASKLSEEEQLQMLRNKLVGHRAFAKCRGQFEKFNSYKILGIDMVEPQSPTAVLRSFNEWCSLRKVMLSMLATLRRDGHEYAHRELYSALTDPKFVITGEEIPLQDRESGVLIIPDLHDALLLARWLYTSTREDAVHWVVNGSLPRDSHASPELTEQLFEAFPGFANYLEGPWPSQELLPYGTQSCPSFWRMEKSLMCTFSRKLYDKFSRSQSSTIQSVCVDYTADGIRNENWMNHGHLGYFVRNADVSEVLKIFTRDEQDKLSVWRFSYPKCDADEMFGSTDLPQGLMIGLHPEDEHLRWKKMWPSYVSSGCASGLGAVLLGVKGLIMRRTEKFNKYSPLEGLASESSCEQVRDIEHRRIVIRLPWRD